MQRSAFTIVAGILVVAFAATVADWVWYTFGVRDSVLTGVLHGALLLTVVGGALGAAAGQWVRGLPIGMLSGIAGALAYYAFASIGGGAYGAAIPAAWVVMWLVLGMLDGRWLRASARRSWTSIAARGVLAAMLSGIAFYLVMRVLWGPAPGGRNYALQFAAWAFAWAPGLLALSLARPTNRR
jgi:hypothetical protein